MFSGTNNTSGIASQGKAAAPRPARDGCGAANLFSSASIVNSDRDERRQIIDYSSSSSNVINIVPMRHRSAPGTTILADQASAVEDRTSDESMIMEFLYESHDNGGDNVCGSRSSHMMIINPHDGPVGEEAAGLKQASSAPANYIIDDDRNHVVVAGNNGNYSGSGDPNLNDLAVLPVPDNNAFHVGFKSRRSRDVDVASIFRSANANSSSTGKKANTFLKPHHHLTDENGSNNSNNFNFSHERSLQNHAAAAAATTTVNVDAHGIIHRSTKRLRASTKDGTRISLFPDNTTSVSFDYQGGISGGRVSRLYRHSILPSMPAASGDQTDAAIYEYSNMYLQDSVGPFQARAKRGCATHPRSIAERVRRTRINERIRKLKKLFPDLDKQTSTSDMLDMALDYMRNLQNQVKRLADIRENCTCSNS